MKIKIVVADDSQLVRQVITDILTESGEVEIVGKAGHGREAVELTTALKPDLVIMDLLMPVLDGLQAIEEIMATVPTPVLVLSAAVEASEVDRAFNAIKRGALDVMEKPALHSPAALEEFASQLLEKVKFLSRVRVIRHPRRKVKGNEMAGVAPGAVRPSILAIGASTGGPKAVMTLLKQIPAGFPAAVFVVQHIAQGFANGFASWLDRECGFPVKLATDGVSFRAGEALVAPDSCHMSIAEGRIRLSQEAPVNCCRPSIDVFFNSLAAGPCEQVVCLLLTGMGRDGAQGLLRVKEAGGTTIVQDEGSCAIFGMPKAAINLRAVDQVLPLESMAEAVQDLFALPRAQGAGGLRNNPKIKKC